MGGRGSKGSNTAKGTAAKGKITVNGDKIEFDGTLKYGKKDSDVPKLARATVEKFEKRRGDSKIEYAYISYPDGTAPIEKKGGKNSVSTPRTLVYRQKRSIYTYTS